MGARKGNQNGKKTWVKPGEVKNPAGRPNIGASTREWFAELWHKTREEVRAVMDDESAPEGRRWAAELVLSREGNDFDRIMDRTEGKPMQRTELTGKDGQELFKAYQGIDIDKV